MPETAVYVGAGQGAVTADPVGFPQRAIAASASTLGAYSLDEMIKPAGEGPPAHIHDNMEEAFFILDGEFTFSVGGEEIRATPGCFLLVPRGTMHGFRNSGETEGRYLRLFSPALTEEQNALWIDLGERVAAARERNEGTTHELFYRELTRPRSQGEKP